MATANALSVGTLVRHPNKPEWGPGKVVHVAGRVAHIVFRDLPDREAKAFRADVIALEPWPEQHDPLLDNLPPLVEKDGKWRLPAERVTFEQAVKGFLMRFPNGFYDTDYIGDLKDGERAYKWSAHELFVEQLGEGRLERLLTEDLPELVRRAVQCVGKVNLLYPVEQSAFRDALGDQEAARRFFGCLSDLLRADAVTRAVFEPYAKAVADLPAPKGRVATWPVATILPFLAQPDRHVCIKPEVTKNAADRLGFNLRYEPEPNWATYEAALRLMGIVRDKLAALKPRDMIDVQSFVYVACGGYERMGL